MSLVEFIYGAKLWRDVKSQRAESVLLVKQKDFFQLFALIWSTAAAICILPVFYAFGVYGPDSDEQHFAVSFAIWGGLICMAFAFVSEWRAKVLEPRAKKALGSDEEIKRLIDGMDT